MKQFLHLHVYRFWGHSFFVFFVFFIASHTHSRNIYIFFFSPCLTTTFKTIKLFDFPLPLCVFSVVISVLFSPLVSLPLYVQSA